MCLEKLLIFVEVKLLKSSKMLDYNFKIKKLREMRNFTQEYMAHCLQLTQRSYSSIENGKTQLTIERLKEIADILKVGIGEILDLENQNVYNNNFNNHGAENKGNLVFKQDSFDALKELYERIISSKENEIVALKESISSLKTI